MEVRIQEAIALLEKPGKISTSNSIIQRAREIKATNDGVLLEMSSNVELREFQSAEIV